MKPAPFIYHRPHSVEEALVALAQEDAKLLAGGQSLMPMMNMRFVSPMHVVDASRIADLSYVHRAGDWLVVGAMTKQALLLENEFVCKECPLMREALAHVGHVQTRSRGTIGGSLCHLDPAAELPLVCLVLDARMTVRGPHGARELSAVDWPVAYMTPALDSQEILTAISLPLRRPGQGDAFVEFARRSGDFAVAAVACSLVLDDRGLSRA